MKFNFDELIERRGTFSMKYGYINKMYPNARKDSIPLWIADMDFACPDKVLDEICNKTKENKILGYSQFVEEEYFEVLHDFMMRQHNWDINTKDVCFSSGIVPVFKNLARELLKEDEQVIFQTPAYSHFESEIIKAKRKTVHNPLKFIDGKYEIDFEDFEEKCKDPKTTLFILCSPHNPTGRVWTKEELIKLANICFENNVRIISDEIHFDILRHGKEHIVLDSLFPNDERIVTCTAPSKTFNIAGLQLSNIVVHDKSLYNKFYNEELSGIPNPLSIYACMAAYRYCDDWLDELKTYLDENFEFYKKFVDENMPKAKAYIPDSTFLAWLDLSGYGYDEQEIQERTQKGGVLIQTQSSFVADGNSFIRINLGCPRSVLKEGLERLKNSLK